MSFFFLRKALRFYSGMNFVHLCCLHPYLLSLSEPSPNRPIHQRVPLDGNTMWSLDHFCKVIKEHSRSFTTSVGSQFTLR